MGRKRHLVVSCLCAIHFAFSCVQSFGYVSSGHGLTIPTQVRIVRHRPVIDKSPRHRGKDPALLVAIVSCHSRMGPDQLLMLGIDLADVFIMRVVADVDSGNLVLNHADQARGDVSALTLGLEDHAPAMCGAGIGTKHAKEIREVRHCQTEIGGRIVVTPDVPRVLPLRPVILSRAAISVTLKPVEITMTSAGRNLPSDVTMPSRVKRSVLSVTSSTFVLVSVLNQPLSSRMRLP